MTDAEIVRMLIEYSDRIFPKVCGTCGRRYATFREYILNTRPVGSATSYDAELLEFKPENPIGSMVMANCTCGTTLALSTNEMSLAQTHRFLEWIQFETRRRGVNQRDLLEHLRDEVRKQVLSKPDSRTVG